MTDIRHDAQNINGITALMNSQNIKPDVDLNKAEAAVMGKKVRREHHSELDPIKLYQSEINRIADEIGFDLGDTSNPTKQRSTSQPIKQRSTSHHRAPSVKSIETIPRKNYSKSNKSSHHKKYEESEESEEWTNETGSEYTDETGSEYTDETGSEYTDASESGTLSSGFSSKNSHSSKNRRHKSRNKSEVHTNEQDRRSQIHNVMSEMRTNTTTTYGIENERVMDLKIQKLEIIDTLKNQLEDDGISVKTIGNPTVSSSLEEIDATLKILTLKADRSRYSTIFEEGLLCCAEAFETVFDGTRKIPFIGMQPDYTGYSSNLSSRLVRCRGATSSIVGDVIEKHSISPTTRLMMELLPSFLLYPHMNSKTKNKTSLHSEFVNRSIGSINASEKQQNMSELYDL